MTIFISYRRADAASAAGRLYDQLARAFGRHYVFMDVDSIKPGEDFETVITERLKVAEVVLVAIGPNWLTRTDDSGRRRLDDPKDYVRFEIAAAIRSGKVVIPVLVDAAVLPTSDQLPLDISPLATKQAAVLRNESYGRDIEALISGIKQQVTRRKESMAEHYVREIAEGFSDHLLNLIDTGESRLMLYFGLENATRTPANSYVYRDALVQLITFVDTHYWLKQEGELDPDDFWRELLRAIASSYRLDLPYDTDDVSDLDLIRMLLDSE